VQAADRLRLAFDGARIGFSSLKDWRPVTAIDYGPATGPSAAALKRTRAEREFNAAWAVLDEDERAMVTLVVLWNVATGRAADMLGLSKPLMTTRLVAALGRLCTHYDIRAEPTAA
jgi:DNA-directed RNA polymerase specialized sigma24 family protein